MAKRTKKTSTPKAKQAGKALAAKAKTSRKASATKPDVESYTHEEAKRLNIPTAENQKLVADEDKAIKKLRWPRNPDLDPQLVWRGKDFESDPLEVDAPPIYIQEKIQPRAIIEELRRQTKGRREDEGSQFDFFHDFNGLPEDWKENATESYYHDEGNWSNRMILGDSLLVMASLTEREGLRGKVQCVYFDPPYGIRFNSNWQPSTKSKDVRDGQLSAVSREPEVVRAFRDTWNDEIHSYLGYLRDRLVAARDLLAESGSIFVQIGEENAHLVRSLLDEIFGPKNLCTSIIVSKTVGQTADILPNVADYILWYAKDRSKLKYRSLLRRKEFGGEGVSGYRLLQTSDGVERPMTPEERAGLVKLPPGSRAFGIGDLSSQRQGRPSGEGSAMAFSIKIHGQEFRPSGTRGWSTTEVGIGRLEKADRISTTTTGGIGYVRYFDDFPAFPLTNVWSDTVGQGQYGGEKIYVVQTALAIVERCILLTSDPGDLVLDPTCGSGTTAYVAEQWGRRWITVDTSRVALTLARARLMGAKYDYHLLKDSRQGAEKEGEITGKPPANGPFTGNVRYGFVYERAPHVTLKSIANNAEIDVIWERWQKMLEPLRDKLNKAVKQRWEEWEIPVNADEKWPEATRQIHSQWREARRARQKEIDDSIARNADVEYLYDRSYKARGVVRVAGPFTVESLSPHRVLPMGSDDPYLAEMLAAEGKEEGALPPALAVTHKGKGEAAAATSAVITDFAQVVYENLKASGVQNTKKGERLTLENLRPFASRTGLIAFQGEYQEKGRTKRAAVCIGPEYDTVGYELVRRAAREAADLFDMLIVCGFAFAPEVDESRLHFGELTVLKARMNQDLRMADKLKATGAGNLFVVFGEPDIEIKPAEDGMIKVEIHGMDIFDPTTGEVRSSGGKDLKNDVAAWFIDTDYDEDSFFVRQAYFVGNDPYEGLKRALKAEIDETAWAELNSTVSRPFPKPERGLICVKVINHFGDEVQKVFTV